MHVFWKKGYEGASMHDLTTAMGIQPASLYAFGNKHAVISSIASIGLELWTNSLPL
jgi:AcrR family transcriptional regulator